MVNRYNYLSFWDRYDWSPPPSDHLDLVREHIPEGTRTVLDVGCGDGRFIPAFEGLDYVGIDISTANARKARGRYPDRKVLTVDILNYDPNQYFDLVFSCVTLQHVWPELIDEVAQKLIHMGKSLLLIESHGVDNSNHCFSHDYEAMFHPYLTLDLDANTRLYMAHGGRGL